MSTAPDSAKGWLPGIVFQVWDRQLTPLGFVAVGLLFWLAIRLTSTYVFYGSDLHASGMLFIACFLACFLAGTWLAPKWSKSWVKLWLDPGDSRDVRTIQTVALVLAGLTCLFVTLRIYDLIANRGLLEYANVQQARMADNTVIEGRTTGGIGLISGLGYPIAIPAIVFGMLFRKSLEKWQFWTVIGSFGYYGFFVLLSGSRYILIGPLFLVLVAFILGNGVMKVRWRHIVMAIAGFAVVFGFITVGTRTRDALFGATTATETLEVMPARLQYGAQPDFVDWFAEQPEPAQEAMLGWISFSWYVNHGLYEFQVLLDYYDPDVQSLGSAQFSRVFYFFRVLGLTDIDDDLWMGQIKNNGFYTSFFGPVVMDFGFWGGMCFMLVLGGVFAFTWHGAQQGQLLCLMIYPYFGSVLFSFPTNNLIMAGLGVPIMANIVMATMIAAYVRSRNRRLPAPALAPQIQPS